VVAAIGRSTHVLALVGPNWMADVDQQGMRDDRYDPIVFELVEAARTGRTVVPVLLAGQRMPSEHRLPAPLHWLSSLHAAHVRVESADADIAALVDRLPQPPRRPVAAPPRRPDSAPDPRRRGGVGLLVTLAVLVTAVVIAFTSGALDAVVNDPTGAVDTPVNGPTGAVDTPVNEPAPPQDDGAAPPQGAGPSLTKRSLKLTPRSGTMTTRITATGTGFTPGATVDITFGAQNAAEVPVGSGGRFSWPFSVPEFYRASPTFNYMVTATERDTANFATANFTLNN
jgi:hypothetical protein